MGERVQVLIVDDSSFYRKRICAILGASADIEVIGEATNGEEALHLTKTLSPDLVTMDVAMPVMDGIAAVRRIMAEHPTPVIMFSALTRDGALSTLQALEAGAVDFLPKIGQQQAGSLASLLPERVLALTSRASVSAATRPRALQKNASSRPIPGRRLRATHRHATRLLVIGASTGGPMAIQEVLSGLPHDFPVPVLVAVHMPAAFTDSYAERLNAVIGLQVSEAVDGSLLRPGQVLVAPGGMQTRVVKQAKGLTVQVGEGDPDSTVIYRPSVDRVFESVAECVGPGAIGLVMTGMGADGAVGAQTLRHAGGRIWAQDKDSSTVYGMPRAVAESGTAEYILPLEEIAAALVEAV